jgi:hypothetical protein
MDIFSIGGQVVSISPEVVEIGKGALIGYGIFCVIVIAGAAFTFFKVYREMRSNGKE